MANHELVPPTNPHFFQPLLPGFETHLTIPLAFFAKHMEGKSRDHIFKLRSDVSNKTWEVQLHGRRLTGGWNDFIIAHNLRIGDIVIFKHEGDMVFNVTPFGPTCTEIQYSDSDIMNDAADADDDGTYDTHQAICGSDVSLDYCFVATVTASNLKHDRLCLRVMATRSTALNKQCDTIILVNKEGKAWTVTLRFRESGGLYYISKGWRSFCVDNGRKECDTFVFNLVEDGKSTPMLCVCPEEEE